MITCLLVDDDPALRQLVEDHLTRYGLIVRSTDSARGMRAELQRGGIDLLLLDVMLPDGDGIELCRQVRRTSKIPVIMLTAQGDAVSRVLGLEIGADDYVSKPFEPRELIARIHALMRRSSGFLATPPHEADGARLEPVTIPVQRGFADWQIDWRNRMLISPDNVSLPLSNVEYRLLAAFAERPGEVLSRTQLSVLMRSPEAASNERSIDLAVSRLRAKLRDAPENPRFIHTVRGRGYRFAPDLMR
jgi:two-component system OmpR family response regulator